MKPTLFKSIAGPMLVFLAGHSALANPSQPGPASNPNWIAKFEAIKNQERMHALLKNKARQGGSSQPKPASASTPDPTLPQAAPWKNPGTLTGPKGWPGHLQYLLTMAMLATDPRMLATTDFLPNALATCRADDAPFPVAALPQVAPFDRCPAPGTLPPSWTATFPDCDAPDLDPGHRSALTVMGKGKLLLEDPSLGNRTARFAFRADSPSLAAKGFLLFDDDDLGLSFSGTAREVKVLEWQDGVARVVQFQGESSRREESARFCCTVTRASEGKAAHLSLSILGEGLDFNWPLMPLSGGYLSFN